ncbi:hypothetical protein KO491_11505 [Roseovarius nubinhibens]|uniref:hypothetical protein n=1 Tax=Roseovarius nubinhibens TaxID=314263 RepID=UPI001C095A2B|nr:hypothetical protein [Roseovarius nubinhibens]MBU3000460.1 hypothetical protein [Roseovarius nubinhibens]
MIKYVAEFEREPRILVDDGVEIIDLLPIARLVREQAGFSSKLSDREAAVIARERFFLYARYQDPGVEPHYDLQEEDKILIERIRDWAMWFQAYRILDRTWFKKYRFVICDEPCEASRALCCRILRGNALSPLPLPQCRKKCGCRYDPA